MLTVLCPVYNEAAHIGAVLQFFTDANPAEKELWIIDGGSTDQTLDIVQQWMHQNPQIRLLHNPDKTVPFALNLGLRNSSGNPVVRLDAHTEYAADYFEQILRTFEATGADIVGGPMRCKSKTTVQAAVAYCTATTFGIGDSMFHQEDFEGYSESVYLGAWQRSVFEDIGVFDEALLRNQDDEFHYRARAHGKRIYQNPAIRSMYYPRDSFGKLFRQYRQYGFYKPLVFQKVQQGLRVRHLIPAAFVVYLLSLPLGWFTGWWLAPLLVYLLLNLFFSLTANGSLQVRLAALLTYPTLHVAYGVGFLHGLWHWNLKRS